MQAPERATTQENALAIVAKYPRPGFVKTRLGVSIGYAAAANLYGAFLNDLALRFGEQLHQDSYDLHWACVAESLADSRMQEYVGDNASIFYQRGADFAERLYHIAADLHARHYSHIVIMSSDSPQLPAALVQCAFQFITPERVVLGPAEDGGYYLIGFDVTAGVPDLFRGIEMSTPQVLQDTIVRLHELGLTATLLPPTFDVDDMAGLHQLSEYLSGPNAAACPHTQAALARINSQLLLESEAL